MTGRGRGRTGPPMRGSPLLVSFGSQGGCRWSLTGATARGACMEYREAETGCMNTVGGGRKAFRALALKSLGPGRRPPLVADRPAAPHRPGAPRVRAGVLSARGHSGRLIRTLKSPPRSGGCRWVLGLGRRQSVVNYRPPLERGVGEGLGSAARGRSPSGPKDSYLVDPASSHMLVSKIKPCMCKYKLFCTVKLRMAH